MKPEKKRFDDRNENKTSISDSSKTVGFPRLPSGQATCVVLAVLSVSGAVPFFRCLSHARVPLSKLLDFFMVIHYFDIA